MKRIQITKKKIGNLHRENSNYKNPKKSKKLRFNRIILKISGEVLGTGKEIFNLKSLDHIIKQIAEANRLGVKIGVVIGGGNLIRGREVQWLNKVDADICGMLSTVMNGIVIYSQLRKNDIPAELSSGIEVAGVVKRCNKFRDLWFYESGTVLIFVGGTGNPLFTTDTAAALRAVEFCAEIVIKATKVEGVYSADPKKYRTAKFYKKLTFNEAIEKQLAVMDLAAFNICRDSNIPINVYDFNKYPLCSILQGKDIGTLITNGG